MRHTKHVLARRDREVDVVDGIDAAAGTVKRRQAAVSTITAR